MTDKEFRIDRTKEWNELKEYLIYRTNVRSSDLFFAGQFLAFRDILNKMRFIEVEDKYADVKPEIRKTTRKKLEEGENNI